MNIDKDEISNKEDWKQLLNLKEYSRITMNKLIMNYLVTEGFKEAAEKFQLESGVCSSVELDSLDGRIEIRNAIVEGNIQDAIIMINRLHPELLDNDRYLYFHLQQLYLIELIRKNHIEEALAFAQFNLSEAGEEDPLVLTELERTLALLAFDDPGTSPFGDLLKPAHKQKVVSEVNSAILKMENQESTLPKISTILKLILWSQEKLDKRHSKYPKMIDLVDTKFTINK